MSVLDNVKFGKLSVLYDGDKKRDASSNIRGFLFQDYVTIECLLKDNVVYVCSEYLEDIDVIFDDGTFELIQVKYYPKTSPNMKEIMTDLYYQYLRFQVLQSGFKAKPSLYIHRIQPVEKPDVEKMKEYIERKNNLPSKVNLPKDTNSEDLLKTVNGKKTKLDQKKALFAEIASEESLNGFIKECHIEKIENNIKQYKEDLMEKLAHTYVNDEINENRENWKLILLGIAISYIQRRYALNEPSFEELRIDKKEFDRHMTKSVQTKNEKTIVSYLAGIVCYEFGEIINNDNLSDLQTKMLSLIYKNTIQWINSIAESVDGQYQLLNTLSTDSLGRLKAYKDASISARLLYMAECKPHFQTFLDYLWKIMLNICQEKVNDEEGISAAKELFDPVQYFVSSESNYICLNFPEDQGVSRSVILPPAGRRFRRSMRALVERIVNMSSRPEKWFFENDRAMAGKNYYSYSTANVNEDHTVADLGEDSFYIECMECIGIDEDDWNIKENCGNCIFSLKCVKEGK